MNWNPSLELYWTCLHSRIKAGRGMGSGKQYSPWLGKRENPAGKTFAIPLGLRTDRKHQLRGLHAETYFYLVERLADVRDIQELYPILDLDTTLKICGLLDVNHEYDETDPEPFVVDFIITRACDGEATHYARSLGPASGVVTGRQLESFHVIQRWCKLMKMDWRPVDVSGLTSVMNDTLIFLRSWHRHQYEPEQKIVASFVQHFHRTYRRSLTLEELLADVSTKTGENVDLCTDHFRYAGWAGFIKLDLRQPLGLHRPVILNAATNS